MINLSDVRQARQEFWALHGQPPTRLRMKPMAVLEVINQVQCSKAWTSTEKKQADSDSCFIMDYPVEQDPNLETDFLWS
jgi:hypothetical protein